MCVPVRVWAETSYGMVAVVANSLTIDGQPLAGK